MKDREKLLSRRFREHEFKHGLYQRKKEHKTDGRVIVGIAVFVVFALALAFAI